MWEMQMIAPKAFAPAFGPESYIDHSPLPQQHGIRDSSH
jgi:hypothetical protein